MGHTCSWARQTISFRAQRISPFVVGLFKIYRALSVTTQQAVLAQTLNGQGLLATQVLVINNRGYRFNSLRPALPNKGVMMPLKWIPVGLRVCWVSFYGRSGGTSLQLLRHRRQMTQLRLPSRKQIWLSSKYVGLIGRNGHSLAKHNRQYRAGDRSWLGRRPQVRGVAMNPVDHPHGGGQGKTSGGRCGVSPWGQLAKGYRTRLKVGLTKFRAYAS